MQKKNKKTKNKQQQQQQQKMFLVKLRQKLRWLNVCRDQLHFLIKF